MSMSRKLKKKLMAAAAAATLLGASIANAMPTGGEVVVGADKVTGFSANPASGATIANTGHALINWNAFDIGAGEILNFNTAAGTILMNQVTGNTATSILGTLKDTGSGSLWICNPNGIYVGPGAVINPNALTLATIQNLNVEQFNHFAAGGELTLYPQAGITVKGDSATPTRATINAAHVIEMLATSISIEDYVTLTTDHSVQTYRAIEGGVFTAKAGEPLTASTEAGKQPVATPANTIVAGNNADIMDVNDKSTGNLTMAGGTVTFNDMTCFDAYNGAATLIAASNINEQNPKASNAIGSNTVTFKGNGHSLWSDNDFGAHVYAGKVIGGTTSGEYSYFKPTGGDPITLTGGSTTPTVPEQVYTGGDTPTPPTPPTPPEPDPPTPPTPPTPPEPDPPTPPTPPEPGDITDLQKAQAHEGANNLLDSAMNNDALKALQDAVSGSQKGSETGDHVTVQTGAEQNTGPNITKGLEGLTVKEASARVRSIAKDYMKALNSGNKGEADRLKEALKEANQTVKVLKEQEKLAKEETEKTKDVTSTGQQPVSLKSMSDSDLLNRESALRDALRKAQTSEERQQIMRDLDAVHGEQTDRYKAAQQTTQTAEQPSTTQQALKAKTSELNQLLNELKTTKYPSISELLNKQSQQSGQQDSGITITAGEQKEPEGVKWINDVVGERLLTQESNARQKLRNAKTSEERAAAMKELDDIHAEETKLVNEAIKKQEQEQKAAEQQARLEVQRRYDEQLKAVGGEALQSTIDNAALARQVADSTMDLLRATNDLYEEADKECRKLSDQYWKEKDAGASPERLEEINQKWQELNKVRNELKESVSEQWKNANEAREQADDAAALQERAQTLAEIGKMENQKALDEKAELEGELAKAQQQKAQADAAVEAARANADAADKALADARKEKEAAQAAADAWSDRYDREHGGGELQSKLAALDQRLESLQNQYNNDSTTPEQADRINEEISRAYEEKERLENAYDNEKEKAFENSAENRSLQEAENRLTEAFNDARAVGDAEYKAGEADEQVTYWQNKVDEKQSEIDNATKTFEDRLDPESAIRRAESDLALAKMREDAAAENLAKAKEENKNKAQRAYEQAKDNTRQAMIAAGKASMLSKYDADAELSKLKAQQAKEQAANEQAARQAELAKEQAANRAAASESGNVIYGGPTISQAR